MMGANRSHPAPMNLIIRKAGWAIPAGTQIEILATFPNGSSRSLLGKGRGNAITILLGDDQLVPWVHELTANNLMTLSFHGNEPPWAVDLKGTSTVVNAMEDCFRSHQIAGVAAPFSVGSATVSASMGATQPFGGPAAVAPSAPVPQEPPLQTPTSAARPHPTSLAPPRAQTTAIGTPDDLGASSIAKASRVDPAAYKPVMDIFMEDPLRPIFHGRTNLPDGAELMLTLSRPASAFLAQTKMSVASGQFVTERFSQGGRPLNPGRYKVEVSMSIASLQSLDVQAIVGEHGEKMSGPLVTPSMIGPEEQVFDFTVMEDLGGPADAALDAASKAQSMTDLRDWLARGCTTNLDFVNALVRSGAVTGTEIVGEERRRRIDECVADARTRQMP